MPEGVHRMATKMLKSLKHQSEGAGTAQPGKEMTQGGNLINMYKYLGGVSKEDRATLISVLSSELTRQQEQAEIQEIPHKYKIKNFTLMGLSTCTGCPARLWSHHPWRYLKTQLDTDLSNLL